MFLQFSFDNYLLLALGWVLTKYEEEDGDSLYKV